MIDVHKGLPLPRRAVAIFVCFFGSLALQIDVSIAGVVLPSIARALNVDSSLTVLIVIAYQLVLAMTVLPLAALGERIGHRRLFQTGMALQVVAATLSFLANSLPLLIAARSLQALATAAAMSVAVGQLRAIYPPGRLGGGLALNTIANAGGTALAPVVGGLVLSIASWHWAFAAMVPFSIIALLFSRALPDPTPHRLPFDGRGAALCALTFGLVIAGLECVIHSSQLLLSLGLIALGALVGWVFVRHELGVAEPVLPLDLLAVRAVALSIIASFSAVLGTIGLALFMPFQLQHAYGFSPGEIGGLMSAYAVATFMIAPLAGYLSDRIPVALLSTIGMSLASIGLLFIAFLPAHPSHFDIVWRMGMCGAGFGMFFSPNARLILASAPTKRSAAAGSLFTTSRVLGQAIGATLVAALFALNLGDGPVPALVSLCLALIAGAISASSLRNTKAIPVK